MIIITILVLSIFLIGISIPIGMSVCCQGDSQEASVCETHCKICFPSFTNYLKKNREKIPEYADGYSRTDFLRKT